MREQTSKLRYYRITPTSDIGNPQENLIGGQLGGTQSYKTTLSKLNISQEGKIQRQICCPDRIRQIKEIRTIRTS